jgi:hypothetical protein
VLGEAGKLSGGAARGLRGGYFRDCEQQRRGHQAQAGHDPPEVGGI